MPPGGSTTCSTGPSASSSTQDFQCWRRMGPMAGKATLLNSQIFSCSYSCKSTSHQHHRDVRDSVYQQNRLQGEYFGILRRLGIYVNQPDNYFYQGGSKTGMGYDEEQYSLPRWQDLSVSRQTVYDNTFQKVVTVVPKIYPRCPLQAGCSFRSPATMCPTQKWCLNR